MRDYDSAGCVTEKNLVARSGLWPKPLSFSFFKAKYFSVLIPKMGKMALAEHPEIFL
jgi:hypothetical protein